MKMPRWLTWTFIALLSWGIWAVLCKLLGNALSAEQSQALSTLGMLPIFVPLLLSKNVSLRDSPRKDLFLALMGGMVTCLGNVAYYAALGRGQKVATVVSLTALYPLVTILLAVILLRERLNGVQMGGIALSFVAIWMFNIQDGGGLLSPAIVYAVLPIVLWGLSGFLQKLATNRLSAETAALVYLSAFIPVGIFFAMRAPWPTTLTPRIWIVVLVLGFFLAFGNFAILAAFAHGGKAAVITPLGGLYPVVSVPIAVWLLHERVGAREIVAILCALAAVAALCWESAPGTNVVSDC
ncbi:MAG TPA: DMT family transporter [Chthoniobacteraceae bacterium]|nr:DMT family transporter [Chthoniobacteraceae bacterium]